MIVMLYAGEKITDFSILTAHVSGVGGSYTDLSDLWLNANGAALPYLLSLVYMIFYRKEFEKPFYRLFSFLIALIPTASLMAWVIIPVIYQREMTAADDVVKFLYNFTFDHSKYWVAAATLLLIAMSLLLNFKKGIAQNYIKTIRSAV